MGFLKKNNKMRSNQERIKNEKLQSKAHKKNNNKIKEDKTKFLKFVIFNYMK